MALSDTDKLMKRDTVLSTDLGDEYVMMDIDSGDYFSLDGVSRRIWELLDTPASPDDLVTALIGEYDVDAETCKAEVTSFLQDLLDANILQPA